MIDYSVYMTSNPMDEDAPAMAYGRAQMRESMTFDKFVKHIAEHNGVFSRGTVQGVILDMCECLVEMLLDGKKVQLGALGDFFIRGVHSRCRLRGDARQGGVQSRGKPFGAGGYAQGGEERLDHRRPRSGEAETGGFGRDWSVTRIINTVGAGFACPDALTDAYADVFRAGKPRPYRFNY